MQIFHEWVDVLRIDNGDISAILAYKDSWQCFKKMLRFAEEEKDDIIVGDGFKHSLFYPYLPGEMIHNLMNIFSMHGLVQPPGSYHVSKNLEQNNHSLRWMVHFQGEPTSQRKFSWETADIRTTLQSERIEGTGCACAVRCATATSWWILGSWQGSSSGTRSTPNFGGIGFFRLPLPELLLSWTWTTTPTQTAMNFGTLCQSEARWCTKFL